MTRPTLARLWLLPVFLASLALSPVVSVVMLWLIIVLGPAGASAGHMLKAVMSAARQPEQSTEGLTLLERCVDAGLPFVALGSILAGALITALSGVPKSLPGVSLDSTALFHVERAGAVVVGLIILFALLGRTLKGELPTGFSASTGSVTYTEKVKRSASASEIAATALQARVNAQQKALKSQRDDIDKLAQALDGLVQTDRPSRVSDGDPNVS